MPNRHINPFFASLERMNFSISGAGSFDMGIVDVDSDAKNLVVNSLRVRGYYWGTDGRLYFFFDSTQVTITHTTAVRASFSRAINGKLGFSGPVPGENAGYVDSSTIQLLGSIVIDPSGMSPGSYFLKVTFTAQTQSGNYPFSTSVSYEVVDIWHDPWAVTIGGGIVVAVIGGAILKIASTRKKTKMIGPGRTQERRKRHQRRTTSLDHSVFHECAHQ